MRWLVVTCLLLFAVPALASPDQLLQEGMEMLKAGQIEAAIDSLHRAERQLLDGSRVHQPLGEAYLRLGMQELTAGEEARAREAFAQAKD